MEQPTISLLAAFAVALLGMPLVAALGRKSGLVDRPDRRRKLHPHATPLVGGLAVLLAVGTGLVWLTLSGAGGDSVLARPGVFLPLLAVFLVGLVDDRFRIPGKVKLLGQLAAVGAMVAFGFQIDTVDLFGWKVSPGLLAVPLTVFWLIGCTNSVNLLDGMDGMVGTIGLTMAAGIAATALCHGQAGTAVTAGVIGAAFLGFLAVNLPPARVFMGDSGSLALGLTMGVLALGLQPGEGEGTVVLGPLAVALFLLPIADSCAAFARRYFTGQSIFTTDRGHLHHRLRQAGLSVRTALALVAGLNLLLMTGLVLHALFGTYIPVVLSAAFVAATLVLGRLFGHTELRLVARRAANLLPLPTVTRRRLGRVARVHVQGSCRCWDEIWKVIRERASVLRARTLCFNINMPALHETFHASWETPSARINEGSEWQVQVPVRFGGQVIGCLSVVAESCPIRGSHGMAAMSELISEVEQHIAEQIIVPAPEPVPDVLVAPEAWGHPRGLKGRVRRRIKRMVGQIDLVPAMAAVSK